MQKDLNIPVTGKVQQSVSVFDQLASLYNYCQEEDSSDESSSEETKSMTLDVKTESMPKEVPDKIACD